MTAGRKAIILKGVMRARTTLEEHRGRRSRLFFVCWLMMFGLYVIVWWLEFQPIQYLPVITNCRKWSRKNTLGSLHCSYFLKSFIKITSICLFMFKKNVVFYFISSFNLEQLPRKLPRRFQQMLKLCNQNAKNAVKRASLWIDM